MKIIYRTDETARKVLFLYELFSPGPVQQMKGYAQFFGKDFYAAAEAHNRIFSGCRTRAESEETCLAILSGRPVKGKLAGRTLDGDLKSLKAIKVPLLKENDPYFVKSVTAIDNAFKVHESKIELWFYRIFGFHLPDEITMIIGEYHIPTASAAASLASDPVIIGHLMGYDRHGSHTEAALQAVDIMQHELLHSLIANRGLLVKQTNSNHMEEALLDYFAPGGMLSAKVGLIKNYDFSKQSGLARMYRPYASRESENLEQVMRRYYNVCGKTTIWEFLSRHGFKDHINQKAIKKRA